MAPEPDLPSTPSPPPAAGGLQAEREQLIAELEKDLDRRRVGVLPPVAALAVVASLFLLWWGRADVSYFFSDRTPIELGREGEYHFELAQPNRYARVHGVPSVRGWYTQERDGEFVFLGVNDTPLVVRRSTFTDEQVTREGKRPQPRQNPFMAGGRLLPRDEAGRYGDVVAEYEKWSGTTVKWVLLAEQTPGRDLGGVASAGFLVAFAALNAWLFARGLSLRRR